jgi:hypothetical protein
MPSYLSSVVADTFRGRQGDAVVPSLEAPDEMDAGPESEWQGSGQPAQSLQPIAAMEALATAAGHATPASESAVIAAPATAEIMRLPSTQRSGLAAIASAAERRAQPALGQPLESNESAGAVAQPGDRTASSPLEMQQRVRIPQRMQECSPQPWVVSAQDSEAVSQQVPLVSHDMPASRPAQAHSGETSFASVNVLDAPVQVSEALPPLSPQRLPLPSSLDRTEAARDRAAWTPTASLPFTVQRPTSADVSVQIEQIDVYVTPAQPTAATTASPTSTSPLHASALYLRRL